MGSAAAWPHVDGALGEMVGVPASNVHRLPDALELASAALIEPASVAYHAVRRAGDIVGSKVLVSGGGAIGQLILRIARTLGAARTTLADPLAYNREVGLRSGADAVIDPSADPASWADADAHQGFDVVWEAAGAASALVAAIGLVAKGGVIVQVGTLPDSVALPANQIMAKEIDLRGSIQYHKAFPEVIRLLDSGRLVLDDLVTQRYAFAETQAALEFSLTSQQSIKVIVDVAQQGDKQS
jgi:2-desacetyl-2-hydroxyethyl bacteriochlorophyllide A dehydrogenase